MLAADAISSCFGACDIWHGTIAQTGRRSRRPRGAWLEISGLESATRCGRALLEQQDANTPFSAVLCGLASICSLFVLRSLLRTRIAEEARFAEGAALWAASAQLSTTEETRREKDLEKVVNGNGPVKGTFRLREGSCCCWKFDAGSLCHCPGLSHRCTSHVTDKRALQARHSHRMVRLALRTGP